jgi:hypothetical protein
MYDIGEWKEHARLILAEIKRLDEQGKSMESKIDQLLLFKWQIIGGSAVVGVIVSVMFQLFLSFVKK